MSKKYTIQLCACSCDAILPILPSLASFVWGNSIGSQSTHISENILADFPVGTIFVDSSNTPILRVESFFMLPQASFLTQGLEREQKLAPHAVRVPLVRALSDCNAATITMTSVRNGVALAWITLSDKGSRGERIDQSGPQIFETLKNTLNICHAQGFMLPDEKHSLQSLVMDLVHNQGYDLIVTSGGTGLSPRDITPEALMPLFDRRLEGIETAMMVASLAKTPHAMLSRAIVGTMRESLIITLPGSRKAVAENLTAALPALQHALDKLHGDPTDCGS